VPADRAGAKESLGVKGLPTGTVHFAVKAWDEAGSMGELSNVVRATVR